MSEVVKIMTVGFIAPMDASHVDERPQKRRCSGGSTKAVSTATKHKKVRVVADDHSDGATANHKEVRAVTDDHVDSPTTNRTVISVVPVNMVAMEVEDMPANREVIGGVGTSPNKDDGALPNIGQPSLVNTSEGAPGNNGKGTLGNTGKGTLDNIIESTPLITPVSVPQRIQVTALPPTTSLKAHALITLVSVPQRIPVTVLSPTTWKVCRSTSNVAMTRRVSRLAWHNINPPHCYNPPRPTPLYTVISPYLCQPLLIKP